MSRTSFVNARVETDLKKKAESILKTIGLSKTEAIVLFYRQICLNNGLPFPVNIPNKKTEKVFKDTDKGKNLVKFKNAKDLIADLHS